METILGIVIILLFIALVVGLIKPSLILKWSSKPTRLKVFGLWFIITLIIGVVGVLTSEQSVENEISVLDEQESPKNDSTNYDIISEKEHVDIENGFNKDNLEIRLQNKIDEVELEKIANDLRKTRKNYDYLWIAYYLPEMKVGSGAWATTHFTPDLEIKILGSTAEQSKSIIKESENVKGKIIGKWEEKQYSSAVYVLYQDKGQILMRIIYPNSQFTDEKMLKKQEGTSIRYDYQSGSYNGEYFKVNNEHELEFYNKENKMFTKATEFQ